jgi:cytochrome c553
MRRAWLAVVFAGAVAAAVVWTDSGRAQQTPPAEPQTSEAVAAEPQEAEVEATPCAGVAMQSDRRGGVLAAVPRYGSTYVLVVPSRLAETVPNASAPAVKGLHVGVQGESPAGDVARSLGITNIEEYPFRDSAPLQLLQDVRDEKLDAAVLWAPLAGLAIVDLGLDGMVSAFTVDKPHPAPASLRAAATADPCAMAIADELDVSGVLPAELLVSVDIRDMLDQHPPKFDLARAQEGAAVFNATCARCHGPDAVADPHGLAPVDLRLSIRRFSYPGYHYIVLNGRPSKSMPPFRGTVTDEQIALIYQYLKARSDNLLTAQTAAAPAE